MLAFNSPYSQRGGIRSQTSHDSKITQGKSKKASKSHASKVKKPLQKFPVVGIGASAGGFEALQELFTNLPPDTDMAFVVVVHQHPDHSSMLPELLDRRAEIPVVEAKNGIHLEPNKVYVAPPGKPIKVVDGALLMIIKCHWRSENSLNFITYKL